MRHRNRGTAFAGMPAPEDQRGRHVLDDLADCAVPVLVRVFEQFAELAGGQPFPDHGRCGRRKLPVRRSGRHVDAGEVVVLVTGAALDRVQAVTIGSAADLHGVRMAVVALARKISDGVTVHAARMVQHRKDGFEGGRRGVIARRRCPQLGGRIEGRQQEEETAHRYRQDAGSRDGVSRLHGYALPASRSAALTVPE